jgi:hypothetical protein
MMRSPSAAMTADLKFSYWMTLKTGAEEMLSHMREIFFQRAA